MISEESEICNWTSCPESGTGWGISEWCPRNELAERAAAQAWGIRVGKGKYWKTHSIWDLLLPRLQVTPTFSAWDLLSDSNNIDSMGRSLSLQLWNTRGRSNWGGATLPIWQVIPSSRATYLLTENQQRDNRPRFLEEYYAQKYSNFDFASTTNIWIHAFYQTGRRGKD